MSSLLLFQYLEDVFILRAVTYSSCALLVWDYFLTLDDELVYIWTSPRSIAKYLFIGNRYISLLTQPFTLSQLSGTLRLQSTSACLAFSWAFALSELGSYSTVHFLVLLRVWILYGRTHAITIALLVAFVLYLGAAVAVISYMLSTMDYVDTAFGIACWQDPPRLSWLIWVVEFLMELCLFSLTIFMLWRHFPSTSSRISHLVRSLYIHAIIFFLANILSNVLNIVAWTVLIKSPLYGVANSMTVVLVNITGQRLAINLKHLQMRKDMTPSEVSREVEIQMAVFDDDLSSAVP